MSFTDHLRLCLVLGLALLPILAFGFGIAWLVAVSPLSAPATIALAFAAMVLATPPFCWLAARIMDLIAP